MQKPKCAFTMIELVFVIVILGTLAGIAIPTLKATRDDADIVRIAQNIKITVQDIVTYSMSKGVTDTDLKIMSNSISALEANGDATFSPSTAVINIGEVSDCITLALVGGVNDTNITLLLGNTLGDTKCLAVQDILAANELNINLKGAQLEY